MTLLVMYLVMVMLISPRFFPVFVLFLIIVIFFLIQFSRVDKVFDFKTVNS